VRRAAPARRGRPLRPVSRKVSRERRAFQAVYAAVDARAKGRCECGCGRRGEEHHHTRKPRRSFHTPEYVVLLSKVCHNRCDWPYATGRLVVTPLGAERFDFRIVTAANKFAAREAQ